MAESSDPALASRSNIKNIPHALVLSLLPRTVEIYLHTTTNTLKVTERISTSTACEARGVASLWLISCPLSSTDVHFYKYRTSIFPFLTLISFRPLLWWSLSFLPFLSDLVALQYVCFNPWRPLIGFPSYSGWSLTATCKASLVKLREPELVS